MIVLAPDQRLTTGCYTIKDFNSTFAHQLLALWAFAGDRCIDNDMLGVAANQLGFNGRFFLFWDIENDCNDIAVNPFVWDEKAPFKVVIEGCLSLPDQAYPVTRPTKVEVSYLSYAKGLKQITRTFEGLAAQIFCHEFDHINGKLISDYGNRRAISSIL